MTSVYVAMGGRWRIREARDYIRWKCFFFQAEDGIRDLTVTGVQTCALPICLPVADRHAVGAECGDEEVVGVHDRGDLAVDVAEDFVRIERRTNGVADLDQRREEIGRASCRGRG